MSDQPTCRKTYKEKLRPTPAQERTLEQVVWRCRTLSNTALEQRITAWQRCHISVTRFQQEAELKAIRAEFPEYAALHSHVLQDVLARLDKTYQAFFQRKQAGKKAGFALPGTRALALLHRQGVRQRRTVGERFAGPLHDRAHRRALVAPGAGHHQDGHDQP
jgi:transposase